MANDKRGWQQLQKLKQLQNINFDRKKLSKRVKKAEGATMRHAHKFIVGRLDNMRDVRRHILGWLTLVGVMIAIVALQLMWFQQSYRTTTAATGGTYAEASLGPIDTLNPLYAATNAEVAAGHLLFSSLYTYDESGHLRSDLAKSVQMDTTGTIYTVKIRPDAVWHDGRRVHANDVAFTVNLIKNPSTRSPLRSNWQDVMVKALDDTTLQFQLPASYAAFSHALTFAILPEHILGKVEPSAIRENVFSRAPVGSGPFSFRLLQNVGTTAHRAVHMSAFEGYYKGMPLINRFEVHAFNEQGDIVKAIKTGQVNAAADLSSSHLTQVDTKNYTVVSRPVNAGVYALLNVDKPILKDKVVRQALQLATDPQVIRKGLEVKIPSAEHPKDRSRDRLLTKPALDLPFVKGQLSGADIPVRPQYNIVRAGELLDSAGWKMSGGLRKNDAGQLLSLNVATTKNSGYEKSLEILVGQWRQLGITINTNVVDTNDPSSNFVQNVLQPRSYDVLLYELAIGADPDVYAYWHSSQANQNGYNFSNYKNDTADAALASARTRVETDLRNVKYKAFAKQWLDDVPAIGLYQSVAEYVASRKAQTVNADTQLVSSNDRYASILYWSVNQESVYKTP
ncbi:MAG: putative Extracellular solute-binding protein family 5 [Candidatus Saccharibacteria bacterium]|nr:putative Extracellular solute-binding protein family 5 [Candidatus Saccharibacteria bacterium]